MLHGWLLPNASQSIRRQEQNLTDIFFAALKGSEDGIAIRQCGSMFRVESLLAVLCLIVVGLTTQSVVPHFCHRRRFDVLLSGFQVLVESRQILLEEMQSVV